MGGEGCLYVSAFDRRVGVTLAHSPSIRDAGEGDGTIACLVRRRFAGLVFDTRMLPGWSGRS